MKIGIKSRHRQGLKSKLGLNPSVGEGLNENWC